MHSVDFDQFLPQRNTLFLGGLALSISGIVLTILSLVEPGVRIMFQSSSWLPIATIVVLATGIITTVNALIWHHSKAFYINLQNGILDSVVGLITLTELNKDAEKLVLLVSAYLLIKGIFRMLAANRLHFPHFTVATIGGLLSAIMGFALWQGWLGVSMWSICFCLSVDIMTRGWALTWFGLWLKAQYKLSKPEA